MWYRLSRVQIPSATPSPRFENTPEVWDSPDLAFGNVAIPITMDSLETRIGYKFANSLLLAEALTHPSLAYESRKPHFDNQRLEFLGDAVIQLIVTDELYQLFPKFSEGRLKALFNKSAADLRDKAVMAVNDDISALILKRKTGELLIEKAAAPVSVDVTEGGDEAAASEEPGPKWTTPDGRKVKENEVDTIVRTLSNFRCDEFIEDRTKDEFKSPIFTVSLKGIKTYTISIFGKQGDQFIAVSSESSYPFLISEWKAKSIMKDSGSLIETAE